MVQSVLALQSVVSGLQGWEMQALALLQTLWLYVCGPVAKEAAVVQPVESVLPAPSLAVAVNVQLWLAVSVAGAVQSTAGPEVLDKVPFPAPAESMDQLKVTAPVPPLEEATR